MVCRSHSHDTHRDSRQEWHASFSSSIHQANFKSRQNHTIIYQEICEETWQVVNLHRGQRLALHKKRCCTNDLTNRSLYTRIHNGVNDGKDRTQHINRDEDTFKGNLCRWPRLKMTEASK